MATSQHLSGMYVSQPAASPGIEPVFATRWCCPGLRVSAQVCVALLIAMLSVVCADAMRPTCQLRFNGAEVQMNSLNEMLCSDDLTNSACSGESGSRAGAGQSTAGVQKLIVIGFMGGNVRASNLMHREAMLTRDLQEAYPDTVHAAIFANRHGEQALKTVLRLLDRDGDGHVSDEEKRAARIVIFGHSWGASQTVTLANRLNELGIPVLLTVQVDSVQKQNQNDEQIPPNVREAVNFYQTEGMLRGRKVIVASDPRQTKVLGNFESSYRRNPVSCAGYPWYARAFMRSHIMIENDPVVWSRIEAMIVAKVF